MENNIRKIRNERGLSQARLAKLVGIETNSVYRHEKQQRGLDQTTINKYAKALGCSPSDIISGGELENIITDDNIELLEHVSLDVMSFLVKNDYLSKLTPKQIARFITEVYVIIRDERKENKEFDIDESHLKILYKQVSNA